MYYIIVTFMILYYLLTDYDYKLYVFSTSLIYNHKCLVKWYTITFVLHVVVLGLFPRLQPFARPYDNRAYSTYITHTKITSRTLSASSGLSRKPT